MASEVKPSFSFSGKHESNLADQSGLCCDLRVYVANEDLQASKILGRDEGLVKEAAQFVQPFDAITLCARHALTFLTNVNLMAMPAKALIRQQPVADSAIMPHATVSLPTPFLPRQPQLKKPARFLKGKPGIARVEFLRVAITEVAEKIGFELALAEEFLVASLALFAGGKKIFVQLCVIKAGHGAAIQAQRPGGEHQIPALQRRISFGGGLHELRVVLEQLVHRRAVGKKHRQFIIKLHVIGDDSRHGSAHRLV